MGINNSAVKNHMDALFGISRAESLRQQLSTMSSIERESTIVESICEALHEMGGRFVLPFRFKNTNSNRTSHHLIFVSKHVLGYTIMKEVMAKESSEQNQGVSSFEYNPATVEQPLLFKLAEPLDELGEILLTEFEGKRASLIDIFDSHHVGRKYIKKNYKDALGELEKHGKITVADPQGKKRRKGTFADRLIVEFPTMHALPS